MNRDGFFILVSCGENVTLRFLNVTLSPSKGFARSNIKNAFCRCSVFFTCKEMWLVKNTNHGKNYFLPKDCPSETIISTSPRRATLG